MHMDADAQVREDLVASHTPEKIRERLRAPKDHNYLRDFVYGEMGAARSIKTKDWNYIALRYTTDQIDALALPGRGFL